MKKIKIRLSGTDGNAFSILGKCTNEMRKHKATPEDIKSFRDEAMSGDYDHLLSTCCKWFEVE
jgi:hypothetical protein